MKTTPLPERPASVKDSENARQSDKRLQIRKEFDLAFEEYRRQIAAIRSAFKRGGLRHN